MQSFKADFRQLDRLEGAFLPRPAPVRPAPARRVLPQGERAALVSALEFGKIFSPALGPLLEIVTFGTKPPALSVLRPLAMPVGFALSKSSHLTIADASVSVTVNTPSPIPITVAAEVTNTKIWPVLRF